MLQDKRTQDDYLDLLQQVFQKEGRLPKKSDFSEEDVAMIKSYFGPWPRALEKAGVKDVTDKRVEQLAARSEKRRNAKLRQREQKIQARDEQAAGKSDTQKAP